MTRPAATALRPPADPPGSRHHPLPHVDPPGRTVLTDPAQFGHLLRQARLARRLYMFQVAEKIGSTHSTISYRERGLTEFAFLQGAIDHAAALGLRIVVEPDDAAE